MNRIINFMKKETVLVIAIILAVMSSFFVPPNREYISYIDFRVLGILLSLMIVMEGFQQIGVFSCVGKQLLKLTSTIRQLVTVLVLLCFFSSMLVTNDVALLTFVPFAVYVLQQVKGENFMIPVIVLQTIAANLGSMLTPIGNPQNLYLYNLSQMDILSFCEIMLPYTVCSLVLLMVCMLAFPQYTIQIERIMEQEHGNGKSTLSHKDTMLFGILFLLCVLAVVRLIPYYFVLVLVIAGAFWYHYQVILKVDYSLLLTFIAFFIFIGNMGNMETVQNALQLLVNGKEMWVAIAASQVVSNVPATFLLSGFTDNYVELLKGVNLGGLGTLIASMASLISYKIYAQQYNKGKGRYLLVFTIANVGFLAILTALEKIVG